MRHVGGRTWAAHTRGRADRSGAGASAAAHGARSPAAGMHAGRIRSGMRTDRSGGEEPTRSTGTIKGVDMANGIDAFGITLHQVCTNRVTK